MRLFYSVLVASVAFAGAAFAAGNDNLFGNTVVITSAWAADGANTCYTQTEPAPAAEAKPFCTPNEARAVGDKWASKGPDGSDVSFELVAGH